MEKRGTRGIWITLVILFLMPIACSGSSNNQLIGKWEHEEPTSGVSVILEFKKDMLNFSAAGATQAGTSYTYVDEDTITVRNPDTGLYVETSYAIRGDKLTIAFIGEDKVEYTRVK